jgi:hypothetical protein
VATSAHYRSRGAPRNGARTMVDHAARRPAPARARQPQGGDAFGCDDRGRLLPLIPEACGPSANPTQSGARAGARRRGRRSAGTEPGAPEGSSVMVRTGGPLTASCSPDRRVGRRGRGVNGDGERRPPLAEKEGHMKADGHSARWWTGSRRCWWREEVAVCQAPEREAGTWTPGDRPVAEAGPGPRGALSPRAALRRGLAPARCARGRRATPAALRRSERC